MRLDLTGEELVKGRGIFPVSMQGCPRKLTNREGSCFRVGRVQLAESNGTLLCNIHGADELDLFRLITLDYASHRMKLRGNSTRVELRFLDCETPDSLNPNFTG